MVTHNTGTDFKSVIDRIRERAAHMPDRVAMRQKRYGIWHELTWSGLNTFINEVAASLIGQGVKPGTKIGILSENRREWVLTQFAAQAVGANVVGMYPTSPANEIKHLVTASDTEILFIEDQEQFDKIRALDGQVPALRQLVVFEPKGLTRETYLDLTSFDALHARGRGDYATYRDEIDRRSAAIKPDDTALMVFTSGSTGAPKAAEISFGNYHAACCLIDECFKDIPNTANLLSYLPLSHIAEQNVTVINALATGRVMNFGESLRTINQDLRDIAPELFFGVPRIWEKMYSNLMVQLKTASPLQRRLSDLALKSARQRAGTARGDWSVAQRAANLFWDLLIYRHMRSYLGLGRTKTALTAAAPISPDLLRFFRGIGINIREIWGMTETTGAATMQPDWGECEGRVGPFLKGVEGKIAEDGELLVKGGIVFKGYYKNEDATRAAIVDGWLHTGDVVQKFEDQSYSVVDRKKDIMINAAGKNLTPSLIENTMKASGYIKECIIIADRRPYVTALVQLDFETVRLWAETNGVTYTTFRSLAENPEVIDLINREVTRQNADLARVEHIKKIWLMTKELDHDDGEVTATMKVRRAKITEAYAEEIERLYA